PAYSTGAVKGCARIVTSFYSITMAAAICNSQPTPKTQRMVYQNVSSTSIARLVQGFAPGWLLLPCRGTIMARSHHLHIIEARSSATFPYERRVDRHESTGTNEVRRLHGSLPPCRGKSHSGHH